MRNNMTLYVQLFIPASELDRTVERIIRALRPSKSFDWLTIIVGGSCNLHLRKTDIISIANEVVDDGVERIAADASPRDRAKYFARIASNCDGIAMVYIPTPDTTLMMEEFIRNCVRPVAIGAFQLSRSHLMKGE